MRGARAACAARRLFLSCGVIHTRAHSHTCARVRAQIEALSTKVSQLEGTLRQTTKDYIEGAAGWGRTSRHHVGS